MTAWGAIRAIHLAMTADFCYDNFVANQKVNFLFLFVADSRLNRKIFVKKLNFLTKTCKFKKNQSKIFIQLQRVIVKIRAF